MFKAVTSDTITRPAKKNINKENSTPHCTVAGNDKYDHTIDMHVLIMATANNYR